MCVLGSGFPFVFVLIFSRLCYYFVAFPFQFHLGSFSCSFLVSAVGFILIFVSFSFFVSVGENGKSFILRGLLAKPHGDHCLLLDQPGDTI